MSGGVVSIVLVESSRRIWSLKQFFAGELVCAEFSLRLEFGRTVLGLNLASEMVGQRNLLLQFGRSWSLVLVCVHVGGRSVVLMTGWGTGAVGEVGGVGGNRFLRF